jgi:hypothetical protein
MKRKKVRDNISLESLLHPYLTLLTKPHNDVTMRRRRVARRGEAEPRRR